MNADISNDWKMPSPLLRWGLVIILLGMAALVRLYRITEPPRDFWTIRQYYNALSARALFFRNNPAIPEWRKEVLKDHRVWLAEPPMLEWAVSRVYRAIGHEAFWVSRAFTVTAWLAAGWSLMLLAQKMYGFWGALAGGAFFLFAPYGVTASRSWQPDPLMVMGICAAIYFAWSYFEKPGVARLAVAGLVAALATLFKPGGSVLTLLGIFGFMSIQAFGWRRTLRPGPAWGYAMLMLLPPAVVVVFSAAKGWYEPGSHFLTYWAPHLIPTFFFWKGWVGILIKLLTLPGLMAAIVGAMFLPAGRSRALIYGYATGYGLFSLMCSFTTPNHDYWHLQVMPLAAICIGAASVPVWEALARAESAAIRSWRLAAALVLGGAWIVLGTQHAPWVRDRGSSPQAYAEMAREIGEAVGHNTRVVFLDYDFGTPLRYYAEISGWFWPQTEAMLYDRQTRKDRGPDGAPQWNTLNLPAHERFQLFYADKKPEFFVVCRLLKELDLQPGLREFLAQFPVVRQGARYVIYRLAPEGKAE